MIIPQYWAEARLHHRERRRQLTLRRFGWSDLSLEHAQAHAEQRVRDALNQVLAGAVLPRLERRVAYNGAEGLPIREEIVQREGDSVITRNGYGALCLNTPDVWFADIDFDTRPSLHTSLIVALLTGLAVGLGLHLGWAARATVSVLAGVAAAVLVGPLLGQWMFRALLTLRGGAEGLACRRIQAFLSKRPDWRLRLYRTPAGLRLLALHRRFDPREQEVIQAFQALGVDPAYARMCHNQNCFRARLTPKPWRIGLQRLRAPYAAAWRPEHAELSARRTWVAEYEAASSGYAACRVIDTLGQGAVDPAAEQVRQLHDRICQAERELPLA